MKNQTKQYVIVITMIILVIPITLNFILLFPALTPIIGNNLDWLSFWGRYISAAMAFIVLHVQRIDNKRESENNRRENERLNEENRKLQFNILKHQQEMQWLNTFRQASVEYVSAYTYNDLVYSVNVMLESPHKAFYELKNLLDRLAKCDTNLKYINARGNNRRELYNICDSFFILYNDVVDDIQNMIVYIINSKELTFEGFYTESKQMQITDEMKMIINFIFTQPGLNMSQRFNDVAMRRIKIIEERAEKIKTVFSSYITTEQQRIDNILTGK